MPQIEVIEKIEFCGTSAHLRHTMMLSSYEAGVKDTKICSSDLGLKISIDH